MDLLVNLFYVIKTIKSYAFAFSLLETRLEGISASKAGQFAVVVEVYEVAPSLFMVDVRRAAGDTLEYHKVQNEIISCIYNYINMASTSLVRVNQLGPANSKRSFRCCCPLFSC
ncbi:CBL-interacting serine/threonine-protein kinase 24-like [Chenopodium quinoa]|uniref:CBL-interacting serine/threonine-protein kinase 24-like n=1 Tax=Chenopodium quinoa TaxID=63459 RepID=UPI000B778A2F|nr:CBL-interacting serine/threonine-protein kinase 24-like [Chenopodium quinoa]XP_021769557.1 CBL-interacting serine/threonine-protein kinase 24-like [Chenopodium quinoa]